MSESEDSVRTRQNVPEPSARTEPESEHDRTCPNQLCEMCQNVSEPCVRTYNVIRRDITCQNQMLEIEE